MRKFFFYLLVFISTVLVLASLLSLIYNLPFWLSKILDFPRIQYLILAPILWVLLLVLKNKNHKALTALLFGLLSVIIIQLIHIWPYWIGGKEVPQAEAGAQTYSVMVANVLIDNPEKEALVAELQQADPDMLLIMENDSKWSEALQALQAKYPHRLEQPLDNAYGMSLYSKMVFTNSETQYLQYNDVPSFKVRVKTAQGKEFVLFGVHPVAPVPSSKYPDGVGDEEKELIIVGNQVEALSVPAIVAGDYNDVSWSHTERLFKAEGKLHNVRKGRGVIPTFNANSLIMRWPLDHFFVTEEVKVNRLERIELPGSDHFALMAEFAF
jgi:endonuclease/exonuclease/phosphatase (EEP) superfamily protein YafD